MTIVDFVPFKIGYTKIVRREKKVTHILFALEKIVIKFTREMMI